MLIFLQFLLPGKYDKLAVGRTRYFIMVGEDGILFEDGTLSCLDDTRYGSCSNYRTHHSLHPLATSGVGSECAS